MDPTTNDLNSNPAPADPATPAPADPTIPAPAEPVAPAPATDTPAEVSMSGDTTPAETIDVGSTIAPTEASPAPVTPEVPAADLSVPTIEVPADAPAADNTPDLSAPVDAGAAAPVEDVPEPAADTTDPIASSSPDANQQLGSF